MTHNAPALIPLLLLAAAILTPVVALRKSRLAYPLALAAVLLSVVLASANLYRVWKSGPEMQVLDNERHPDGRVPETSAGSNYGLHAPTTATAVHPAGTWNTVRLVVDGSRVEHWLNGIKIVEYHLETPEWEAMVAATKFDTLPFYGRVPSGHIALQDHGDWVAYRNVKIRRLR